MILQCVEAVWQDNGAWQHGSIDNYDGGETYHEWSIQSSTELKDDEELLGTQYKTMRNQLIQMEQEIGDAFDTCGVEQVEMKADVWNKIQETFMQLHHDGQIEKLLEYAHSDFTVEGNKSSAGQIEHLFEYAHSDLTVEDHMSLAGQIEHSFEYTHSDFIAAGHISSAGPHNFGETPSLERHGDLEHRGNVSKTDIEVWRPE